MISSYRTYEEWKQSIADAIGVEVQCSYRTYEEWKQCQPPKTKQPGSPSSYRTYEEWKLLDDTRSSTWNLVLTVPMRNGNASFQSTVFHLQAGSYRTYEEWKLPNPIRIRTAIISSYRTYEEWKQWINFLKAR